VNKSLAIIDVDSTLYDFQWPWYEELKKVYGVVPAPPEWDRWDLTTLGIPKPILVETANLVHVRQNSFEPFIGSALLLHYLRRHYHVVIATHRKPKTKIELLKWLDRCFLVHDEVHISGDKTVLFGDAGLVIDDCPATLRKAELMGIKAVSIAYPWNQNMGHLLFPDTLAMLDYLMSPHKYQYLKGGTR
jgi:hypothetical protein